MMKWTPPPQKLSKLEPCLAFIDAPKEVVLTADWEAARASSGAPGRFANIVGLMISMADGGLSLLLSLEVSAKTLPACVMGGG